MTEQTRPPADPHPAPDSAAETAPVQAPVVTRRGSLAAVGAMLAVPVAAQPGGQVAGPAALDPTAPRPLPAVGVRRPAEFGAPLNGLKPDQDGIQRAIDSLTRNTPPGGIVRLDDGRLVTTAPIDLRPFTELDFGRAAASLQPTQGYAIGIGWGPDAPVTAMATVRGRALQLHGANQVAIAVRNGSGAQILETDIDLNSPGQTGLRVVASDSPHGPYYGLVDNVRINGNGQPGQRGIVLEFKPVNGSICVNRWIFSNIRHLASVDVGLDVQGADGLVFQGVNFESCSVRAARFGHANRKITGAVTGGASIGGFTAAALRGMKLDPTGAFQVLSGANAGESMVASSIDPATGTVVFPSPFPQRFAAGDRFVFTESKCRSVTILNATNEGGGGRDEVGFEFLAGARGCRVEIAMTTMEGGSLFRREVEDESNTIARRLQTISYEARLDGRPGVVWLPDGHRGVGRGGHLTQGSCWVDAIYVTGEEGSGGTIECEVFADDVDQRLVARLTPASPYNGRRIRKDLKANTLIGARRHIKVKVTKRDTTGPETLRVDVVLGYL